MKRFLLGKNTLPGINCGRLSKLCVLFMEEICFDLTCEETYYCDCYYCICTVYVVCILEVNSTYLLQCQGEVAQFMVVHLHCDIQIYPSSKFNFCSMLYSEK